ncbi:hypothetical protein DPMN_185454 [Dreissena polymorpha]|uniref:Uncharacterized protein n=1 Tax=Dreissena polymorpha TaxID=45954 RepID=A0A9D4DLF6_DREPO|nr:hypothetical protein DPMN_185454 [Dreissena polymorpha]
MHALPYFRCCCDWVDGSRYCYRSYCRWYIRNSHIRKRCDWNIPLHSNCNIGLDDGIYLDLYFDNWDY